MADLFWARRCCPLLICPSPRLATVPPRAPSPTSDDAEFAGAPWAEFSETHPSVCPLWTALVHVIWMWHVTKLSHSGHPGSLGPCVETVAEPAPPCLLPAGRPTKECAKAGPLRVPSGQGPDLTLPLPVPALAGTTRCALRSLDSPRPAAAPLRLPAPRGNPPHPFPRHRRAAVPRREPPTRLPICSPDLSCQGRTCRQTSLALVKRDSARRRERPGHLGQSCTRCTARGRCQPRSRRPAGAVASPPARATPAPAARPLCTHATSCCPAGTC